MVSMHRSLKFDPSITPIALKPKAHNVITSGRPIYRVHRSLVIFSELIN